MNREYSGLKEILITTESNSPLWTVGVWDASNGSLLTSYKGFNVGRHRLVESKGIIATASSEKPLIDAWHLQHRGLERRTLVTPGIVKAMVVSSDGLFLAAAIDEQIAVWSVSSGELLALLRRHYLSVNVVRFADDCSLLLSGGADGLVLVWDLPSCLSSLFGSDGESGSKQTLRHTLSGHSLAVSDLMVGLGAGSEARAVSASTDRSVRLWDLGTGDCLTALSFDHVVSCVALGPAEYHLYAGCINGDVVEVSLFDSPFTAEVTVEANESNSRIRRLAGHQAGVLCLDFSFDGASLVTGSEDGTAKVWDLSSGQVVRTLTHNSPVNNVRFSFAPYLTCEENSFRCKTPIWPHLQKRMKEHEQSFSEKQEIFHELIPGQ